MQNQKMDVRITFRFFLLLLAVLLSPVLLEYTKSSIFKVLDDGIFVLLCIDAIMWKRSYDYSIKHKNNRYHLVNLEFIVLILFIVYLIFNSFLGILNNNAFSLVLLQLRQYKFFLFFILLWMYNSEDLYNDTLKMYKLFLYLSIPVAFMQRLLISNPSGDVVTGLFGYGASGTLTLLILVLFFSELTFRLYNNRNIFGFYMLFLIPVALNETKIAFVLIPVLFVVALFLSKRLTINSFIAVSLILSILIPIGNHFYKSLYNADAWALFVDEEKFDMYFNSDEAVDIGRFRKIEISFEIIEESLFTNLFGYGIGASFVGKESKQSGIVAASKYHDPKVFSGTKPQLYLLVIDMGLIGVSLLFMFFIFSFIKAYRKKQYKMYDIILMFCIIIIFIGMFYQPILYTPVIMFLCLYSVFMSEINNKRNGENEEDILA